MIEDEKMKQWKAACDKAAAGPYSSVDVNAAESRIFIGPVPCGVSGALARVSRRRGTGAEAHLFALARTALPEAIAEIERLRTLVARFAPRGGGAGGMTVTSWECLACGGQHAAGSTAGDTVCRECRRAALGKP